MRIFINVVFAIAGILVTFFAVIAGITYLNSYWNCHSWHQLTGDDVSIVAAECMVKDRRTGRWEIYGEYIKHRNVDLTVEE